MPLADTLADILQMSRDAATDTDGAHRALNSSSAESRATAICTEIGQTMLPRKLTFTTAPGAELQLEAGGRRLLRVLAVEPADLAASGDTAFLPRDDAKLAAQMKALARLIAAFAETGAGLTVTSDPAIGSYAAGALGFVPEKLAELAITEAKSKAAPKPVEKPPEPAAKTPAPAAPEPVVPARKIDPTAAMKAMIRQKVEAAATAPKAAPVIASAGRRPAGASLDDSACRAFFAELENQVEFCAVLNSGGNVEALSGQAREDSIVDFGAQIVADLHLWLKYTNEVLSKSQIVVLRAGGIQNHSVALFTDPYGVALAVFVNTDLSRIFQIANKLLVPGGRP
jgi:hypothetical protein